VGLKIRRLAEIDNELERAVFMARYGSLQQRVLRLAAVLVIAAKHGLRGLLYVWPLAILVFVEFPGVWNLLRPLLLALAAAAWFRFIYASVRDDYARFVAGEIFDQGAADLWRVL